MHVFLAARQVRPSEREVEDRFWTWSMVLKISNKPNRLDPNKIKTRDPLLVKIIQGATKSGPQKNLKKEDNKKKCRRKVLDEG